MRRLGPTLTHIKADLDYKLATNYIQPAWIWKKDLMRFGFVSFFVTINFIFNF